MEALYQLSYSPFRGDPPATRDGCESAGNSSGPTTVCRIDGDPISHLHGLNAEAIIAELGLLPHPEGGHFVETWRGQAGEDDRAVGTAIYFLLAAGDRSHWHRIDATEIWHFHAGAPLTLRIAVTPSVIRDHVLGTDLAGGQRPQIVVPPRSWQSAHTDGDWTLVSCTVSPGFQFDRFELAPPGWSPGSTS